MECSQGNKIQYCGRQTALIFLSTHTLTHRKEITCCFFVLKRRCAPMRNRWLKPLNKIYQTQTIKSIFSLMGLTGKEALYDTLIFNETHNCNHIHVLTTFKAAHGHYSASNKSFITFIVERFWSSVSIRNSIMGYQIYNIFTLRQKNIG